MPLNEELKINNLLENCLSNFLKREENEMSEQVSKNQLEQAYKLINGNVRDSLINLSSETLVKFCEISLRIKQPYCEQFIDLYLKQHQAQGQMYVRGLLIKAQLVARQGYQQFLKAEAMIENIKKALKYIQQALDQVSTAENKIKYSFLIYNISVAIFEIIRPMMRPQWSNNFQEILEKIDKLFEDIDEMDFNWRCKITLTLFQCIYDAGKQPEAFKILDKLWDLTKKKKECDFQDNLLRIRLHYGKENAGLLTAAKKDAESGTADKLWKQLSILQQIKSGAIGEALVEKELIGVVSSIHPQAGEGEGGIGSVKLSVVQQERIAESGRVALQVGLLGLANNITKFVSRISQLSQKALVMHEYNKAELMVRQSGSLVDKQGMRLSQSQLKQQEVDRRLVALKVLEKTMSINKKVADPELIYEGGILIWNMSLPFLKEKERSHVLKGFAQAASLLEAVENGDHQLRVNLHLELGKADYREDSISKADCHVRKALMLDPSIPFSKLKDTLTPEQDPSLYQRPQERHLFQLRDKIKTQLNTYQEPEQGQSIEKVILDLQQASQGSTQESQREELLWKSYQQLMAMEGLEQTYTPQHNLVEEELNHNHKLFIQRQLQLSKERRLLAREVAQMAHRNDIDLAIKACEYVVEGTWETTNSAEVVLAQVQCYFILASIQIQLLSDQGLEMAYVSPIRIDDGEEETQLTEQESQKVTVQKELGVSSLMKGLKLADSLGQSWLIFNGAIIVWNSCLKVFRQKTLYSQVMPDLVKLLKEFFEVMKNTLLKLESKSKVVDFDLDGKIEVMANLGQFYGRVCENQKQGDEVMRVCEALLGNNLSLQSRKRVNQLKARNQGGSKGGGAAAPKKDTGKKGVTQVDTQDQDQLVIFEVVQQLENIEVSQKGSASQEMIKKTYTALEGWKSKDNDEREMELYSELWTRLARLALDEKHPQMNKYALKAVENSINKAPSDLTKVPVNRLRWYAMAEHLYSETLLSMVKSSQQEPESQHRLLFFALKHAVESANKADKAKMAVLVLDAAKQVWNISSQLADVPSNRQLLINPLFSTLQYMKQNKVRSEPDLVLLLSQLLFKACLENKQFQLGEDTADIIFQLIPKTLQKPIWEAKLIFMSKQGKNEQQAISNMKESDTSLQAKIWLKLARSASNVYKQFQAYSKAIEILRKDHSIEIVEILVEFSEWLLRNSYDINVVKDNLLMAADLLFEIEIDEDDEDENDDNNKTVFSRSSRNKTNKSNASMRSRKSESGSRNTNKVQGSQRKSNKDKEKKNQGNEKTKSLFGEKKEDSNPEKLDCKHYEKLLRIHAMLALIAKTQEEKIQNALEGKFYVINMYRMSFESLKEMEVSNEKYNNLVGKSAKEQQSILEGIDIGGLKLPQKVEEWVKLEETAEFLKQVNEEGDASFMRANIFDRAEMTFEYVDQLCAVLEDAGLLSHVVVLVQFQKFLAKHVIKQQMLISALDLKMSRLLHQLSFNEIALTLGEEAVQGLKIEDREGLLEKTRNQKLKGNAEESVQPLVIGQLNVYQLWLRIGRELVVQGQLSLAEDFLQESIKHAMILEDKASLGQAYLSQGVLFYQMGKLSISKEKLEKAHLLIGSVSQWREFVLAQAKVLYHTKGKLDLAKMLNQMGDVLKPLAIDRVEGSETREAMEGSRLDIKQLVWTLDLLRLLYSLKDSVKIDYNQFDQGVAVLGEVISMMDSVGCTVLHLKQVLNVIRRLVHHLSSLQLCYDRQVRLAFKMADKLKSLLEMHALVLNKYLKYVLLLDKGDSHVLWTPLHSNQMHNQLLQGECVLAQGICKQIIRNKSLVIEEEQQPEQRIESIEQEQDNHKVDHQLQVYLNQLDQEIQMKLMPIPYRLESFEKAIALFTALSLQVPQGSPLHLQVRVQLAKAKRLLAQSKGQVATIKKVETEKDQEQEEKVEEKGEILEEKVERVDKDQREEQTIEVVGLLEDNSIEQELNNSLGIKRGSEIMEVLMMEALELVAEDQQTFRFLSLAKAQHMRALQNQLALIRSQTPSDERTKLLEKQMKRSHREHLPVFQHFQETKVFQVLTEVPSNFEMLQLLPEFSSYLSIYLSKDRRTLHVGFLRVLQAGQREYLTFNETLSATKHDQLLSLLSQIRDIKLSLIKTPLLTDQDIDSLQQSQETLYKATLAKLEAFSDFFTTKIDDLVNKKVELSEEKQKQLAAQIAAQGQGGKGKEKEKKDNKKEQLKSVVEGVSLPQSESGIQSLCVLIDGELDALPWEQLDVFKSIVAKSKDFSLYQLGKKYQEQGQKKIWDEMKYIAEDFKGDKDNFNEIVSRVRSSKTLKLSGVQSGERVASVGEWQKNLQEGQSLLFYAHQGLLDVLSPMKILDMLDKNKVDAFLIIDKQNNKKPLLQKNKAKEVEECGRIKIEEQSLCVAQLLSLLGGRQIGVTRWSIDVKENKNQINHLLQSLDEQHSLASSLHSYSNPSTLLIHQHNLSFYGIPL